MNLNPYFKSIIDQDRESVVICDLNHIILYMNPAAVVDYKKYGGASLLGKSLLNCHNPHSVEVIGNFLSPRLDSTLKVLAATKLGAR